jgi:hypothetical protein
MEGGMLPAVNGLAGKVLMTCKGIDNSGSFREESPWEGIIEGVIEHEEDVRL